MPYSDHCAITCSGDNMDLEHRIKLFGMSHALVERDLDKVEAALGIDLQRVESDEKDESYYPQFGQSLRNEAAGMRAHYELFYCLERSIRRLVADTLQAQHGEQWWDNHVREEIRIKATSTIQHELDSGVTPRSQEQIDYTTFGELAEIVKDNWPDFGAVFSSQKAFSKIMTSLNTLRGPIAHCCPLAEDEVVRLRLTLADWFRVME